MKIVKYLLIACGGLAVVVGGVVAYIAATFNPNSYKPQVIQLVKDKKQRDLKLEGDIKLKFWPSIGADLGKMSLSEFNSNKEFATVEGLRVSLKLLPLLSHKLVVDEVEVKGVRAAIVKFRNGRMNIDDLLSRDEKKQQQFEFDIDHVAVENAAVTYRDEALGAHYALSNINLKTGRIAPNVPGKIDLSMTIRGNKPKIDAGISLKTRLTFDLEQQLFSLQDMGLDAKGAAADLGNLNVKVSGGVLAKLKLGELTTDNLMVVVTGVSGKDALDIKLEAPKLSITRDRATGDKVTIAAKISGTGGVTIANVMLPGIDGTAAAFKSAAVTLDLDIKQGDQTIKAKISSPLSGNFHTQQFSLPQLGITVTASGPNLPGKSISGSLNGSASVNGSKQQAQANLAGKVSDSTIKALISVHGFAPPGLTFDVDIDQLDVDRYTSPSPPGGGAQAAGGKGGGAGADKPIDLTGLRALQASGKLRIGTLKVSNLKASNVQLQIKANGGRVDISPLSANLYQGTMNGAVSVNAAQAVPSFAIKQNLSGIAIGPLLKDLANKDMLEGNGTVNLDVTTQGATVGAIKRGLNGGAAVHLRDGSIKGIDVAGTIRSAQAKLGSLKGQQTQQADQKQKTDFSELSGTFTIRNGVASNNDLAMKSPLLRVAGAGDINIGEDSLNYLVKASVVATAKGQGGRATSELKGVTVPVRATGPLAAPSFALDFDAMLMDTIKQQAEEKIKGQLEDLLGRKKTTGAAPAPGAPATPKSTSTRDAIKGLFGR